MSAACGFRPAWNRPDPGASRARAKRQAASGKRGPHPCSARFFIDRPIFATVISVVITLAGAVAYFRLPVAQYPEVTPPTVQVTAQLSRGELTVVRDTVAAPIEAQVSGVEGMLYMSSHCTNDGAYNLTITFKMGMDSDMAQVLVQNRVSLALPVIPALVQNEGITVKKMSPNTLMIVNLVSPNKQFDSIFLSNYATIYVKDELGRLSMASPASPTSVSAITACAPGSTPTAWRPWPERHGRGDRHWPAKRPGRRRADRPTSLRLASPEISAHHQYQGPSHRSQGVRRHHRQDQRADRRNDPPGHQYRPLQHVVAEPLFRRLRFATGPPRPARCGPPRQVRKALLTLQPQFAKNIRTPTRSSIAATTSMPRSVTMPILAIPRARPGLATYRLRPSSARKRWKTPISTTAMRKAAARLGDLVTPEGRHRTPADHGRAGRAARLAAIRPNLHPRRQALGGPVHLISCPAPTPWTRPRAFMPR